MAGDPPKVSNPNKVLLLVFDGITKETCIVVYLFCKKG